MKQDIVYAQPGVKKLKYDEPEDRIESVKNL